MRVKLTKKLTWDSILLVLLVALGTFAFLAILFFFLVFLVVELIFIFILYIPGYSLAICARLCVTGSSEMLARRAEHAIPTLPIEPAGTS